MSANNHYNRIIVAVDFDHQPETVLKKAVDIAQLHQSPLKLIHCIPHILSAYFSTYDIQGYEYTDSFENIRQQSIKSSNQQLHELVKLYQNQEIVSETLEGDTVDRIIKAVENYSADLIILGSHGKGVLRSMIGSTSNGVIQRCPCDVLLIKP